MIVRHFYFFSFRVSSLERRNISIKKTTHMGQGSHSLFFPPMNWQPILPAAELNTKKLGRHMITDLHCNGSLGPGGPSVILVFLHNTCSCTGNATIGLPLASCVRSLVHKHPSLIAMAANLPLASITRLQSI